MRQALSGLHRYIASPAQAKRIQFSWVDTVVCPSNLVTVFAFEDDYSMGVLASSAHGIWLSAGWSTLEDRLRYTPSTVFATFPWPQPDGRQCDAIASAARAVHAERARACRDHHLGLTDVYNLLDEGGFRDLAAAQAALDRAVSAAYGWRQDVVHHRSSVLRSLLERNLAITAGEIPYHGPPRPE
jgi:hypothetical protein